MQQENDFSVNDDEISAFRRTLRTLEQEITLALESQTECCGITLAQCHALLEIAARGQVTAGELAAGLALDKSTMSRTMTGLESMGWVERTEDPDNRRRVFIKLSEAGARRVEHVDRLCNETYKRMLSAMDEGDCRTMMAGTAILAAQLSGLRTGSFSCCAPKRRKNES